MVVTGLDVLARQGFERLKGTSLGVLCNQASVDSRLDHILDLLLPFHRRRDFRVTAVFGPQHGLFGHTQDNMIEWEGAGDPRTGWRVHSLYGQHRKPTEQMLDGIELMVVDLQDVGARYYTFIWTMLLCIEACAERQIPVLVLDRPNPIGGVQIEGPVMEPRFSSFVGLRPLPARHGLTVAEIADLFYGGHFEAVRMEGWKREMYFEDTGLPWAMPSPNMPSPETAVVYPGGCLLEATNLSEGRGTTRPFEIVGAPYLEGYTYCELLNGLGLPGVKFRPIEFAPTFNKHSGKLCQGCFIHVLDRKVFEPVRTGIALIEEAIRSAPGEFRWKEPPYEYEYEKLPIDILAGNDWLRPSIEALEPLDRICLRYAVDAALFRDEGERVLQY